MHHLTVDITVNILLNSALMRSSPNNMPDLTSSSKGENLEKKEAYQAHHHNVLRHI